MISDPWWTPLMKYVICIWLSFFAGLAVLGWYNTARAATSEKSVLIIIDDRDVKCKTQAASMTHDTPDVFVTKSLKGWVALPREAYDALNERAHRVKWAEPVDETKK